MRNRGLGFERKFVNETHSQGRKGNICHMGQARPDQGKTGY